MKIGDIVDRIRTECPGFAHVDHLLTSPVDYGYPAALVTLVKAVGRSPNINISGAYAQDVAMTFGVYIVLARRQSGVADHGGADSLDYLLTSLRAALVNWLPPDQPDLLAPVEYAGGEMAPYEAGLVTWRDDYGVQFDMRRIQTI